MNSARLARYLAELERRERKSGFVPEAFFTDPQMRVRSVKHKRKVLRCSRRAGKTVFIAGDLLLDAGEPPYTHQYYITLSLKNAKRLVWPDLKRLNEEFSLGGITNETEGYMRFPNIREATETPVIFLGGAKDLNEIEKLRGQKGKKANLDEAQSFPTRIITPLLKDIVRPMLLDYSGDQIVSGTPGPLKSGYFWDIDQGELASKWLHFGWTWRENTKLPALLAGKTIHEIEQEILDEHGWTPDNPTYRREYCGEWVTDEDALVFKYLAERNHYELDEMPAGDGWTYVMGVDIGFEDADAIAVLGWHKSGDTCYLVHEDVERKAGVTELGQRVADVYARWKPVKVWIDAGGLGKKIADEVRRRWSVPLEAAEKQRKLEHVELLNDALRTRKFLARRDSLFAQDCAQVQWDVDERAKGKLKIADDFHSDITDAVLYAYRACRHYLYREPEKQPTTEAERMSEHHRKLAEAADAATRMPWWQRDTRRAGLR